MHFEAADLPSFDELVEVRVWLDGGVEETLENLARGSARVRGRDGGRAQYDVETHSLQQVQVELALGFVDGGVADDLEDTS